MEPLRLGLVGWGAIGQTVAQLLADDPVDIVAIGVRSLDGERVGVPGGAELIADPEDLTGFRLDVVAEAAGRGSVEPWGNAALRMGVPFIVSSASAFADPDLLQSLVARAAENDTQVHIQTGALGGIDALGAARLMGVDEVEHRIVKPPLAWEDTPAEQLCDLANITEPTVFFMGSASETASAFPKNANVAMTTALAGIGPDATAIALVADPAATTNRHEISARGPFGELEVMIANQPLPANPKTSALAALSLAHAIKNRTSSLRI